MRNSARWPRPGRKILSTVAVLATATLVLAGCSGDLFPTGQRLGDATPSATPSASPTATGGSMSTSITWSDCDSGYKCATITAPMDWSDTTGETISLALKMLPATDQSARIGSLFINPGGPGGSGIELVEQASYIFTDDILAAYDIVGFDPRGVGASSAVTCFDDAGRDAMRQDTSDPSTADGLAQAETLWADFATAGGANTGELLGHIDTVSSARDLEFMRTLVGDDALNYLGFSYGTFLGSTYADLFPDKVGRLVLDGALDPSISYEELGAGQAAGFENALRAYITDCQQGATCPLTGSVDDGVQQIRTLLEDLRHSPMATRDAKRPLTDSIGASGIIFAMYSEQVWSVLSDALTMAIQDRDGYGLQYLADYQADRGEDGVYTSNQDPAFTAINCLDYPVDSDVEAMRADAANLEQISPTFGRYLAYGGLTCKTWPYGPTRTPAPVAAEGSAPILVIGTTGDPATPYEWAVALAGQLDSGVLLSYEGEGHTAYSKENTCVANYVSGFFLKDEVPTDGSRC